MSGCWAPRSRNVGLGDRSGGDADVRLGDGDLGHGVLRSCTGWVRRLALGCGDRRGGARNLEEAVTAEQGFRPARAGAQRPGELALAERSLGLRSSARVWVARDGASSVTLGDPAERLKVRGYGPRPPQAGTTPPAPLDRWGAGEVTGRRGWHYKRLHPERVLRAVFRAIGTVALVDRGCFLAQRAGWWIDVGGAARRLFSVHGHRPAPGSALQAGDDQIG